MVSFVSLFLGLVFGYQTVAVQVTEPVARVEILLDGEQVTVLDGPDWQSQIDLGSELEPHELVAIAFDERGTEIDRAVQWLNLPRQLAEISIVLERDAESGGSVARLSWESLAGQEPSEVRAVFDGSPIPVQDPRSIQLPAYDPAELHFLRVEMLFAGFLTSSAEITFGGTYTDRVNTELTAFPVALEKRKLELKPDSLQKLFAARGNSLEVAAVEKGQAELLIVRDRGAWPSLRRVLERVYSNPSIFSSSGLTGFQRRRWFRPDRDAWGTWTFQFLWPDARRLESGEGPYDLFSNSQKLSGMGASLHGWLVTFEQPPEFQGSQRLADAVAIAGVTAAGSNRRRGVLLVLGGQPEDRSEVAPQTIRRYLDSLGVPLFVWTLDPDLVTPWGAAVDVSSPQRMERASAAIFDALDRQRIVWLKGIHLPQEIALDPSARWVRTAAGS